MNISNRCILTKSFFNSQFNYCPLVLMFHSRSVNNNIIRLHERVLRITYNDFKSSFENLKKKMGLSQYMSKICKNSQQKMFKIWKNFCVPLMSELFHQKVNHYDLRNPYEFSISQVNSVFRGQGSISYLGTLIWQLLPSEFKDLNTVSSFKAAIKKWQPNNYPCRLGCACNP